MQATATDVSRLNIHRLHALYLVPADHPSPDTVRSKFDGIAHRKLRDAVASAVSRALPDSAADIWLIRSLKLDVDLNLDSSDEQLANRWAQQAAASLAAVLDCEADAHEVLHFPNRAAYLARFLLDLVEGSAWGKWYYRSFEGLRPLPLSAALRTVICHQSATGRNALLQMSGPGLRKVLAALTDHDGKRILNEIAEDPTSNQALIPEKINPLLLNQTVPFENEHCAALSLYLRISAESPAAAGSRLKPFVLAVTCLVRCTRDLPLSRRGKLVHFLSTSNLTSLCHLAGPADAERLTPLLGCTAEWLQAVGKPAPIASHAPDITDEPRHTASGGIFLLLPLLDAIPLAGATLGWPGICKCEPASLVRLLLLMKCFGTAAAQLFADPLVRDLVGITPDLDSPSLHKWQTSLSLAQLFSLQDRIAQWQIENWIDRQRSLTLVAIRSQRSLLCFEHYHQSLLFALPDSRPSRKLLVDEVSAWTADQVPVIANPGELVAAADVQGSQLRAPHASSSGELFGPPMEEEHLRQILDDLDFLRLPVSQRGPRCSEFTFSLAARALLRNFSWRLPGFSRSGLQYLHRNFLDVPASVQNQPEQRTVRLGQPPLHVVLSLCGMTRQRYCLSWTAGAFALSPE
jgi:hypothetical protein